MKTADEILSKFGSGKTLRDAVTSVVSMTLGSDAGYGSYTVEDADGRPTLMLVCIAGTEQVEKAKPVLDEMFDDKEEDDET